LPRRHLGDDAVGHGADQIGRDLHAVHLRQEALDFPHGHAPRVQRQNLVVEAREPAFVFADQPRFEAPLAIARHVDRQRPVIGQHGLAARPVPMIGAVVRFLATGRVAQMVRELATSCALDNGLLEPTHRGVELLG
jgi:hypothetical protein